MTSEPGAFVWVWLPGATEPVVAGAVTQVGDELRFNYGRSYLKRSDSIALQPDGLPLVSGAQRPPVGLDAHGVIRDAAPDSWGMQVIMRRLLGVGAADTNELPLLTYLVESGSNRIGALDFQESPSEYRSRDTHGTLEEIVNAGERMATGLPFSPEVDDALTYGSAVGGARPKALLVDHSGSVGRELIAKFSVSTDTFPWMQAEAIGMELARRCGVDVAPTELTRSQGRDVLLVERFDRPADGTRRCVLSGLTLLGLHEMASRYGTYVDLAEQIRLRFIEPEATLRELFTRIVVNILIGNTDDHPRNISAFWDGQSLALTPAYDMCPQPRSTGEAEQAMAYGSAGQRRSRLADVGASAATYRLSSMQAAEIIDRCATTVTEGFDDVCTLLAVDAFTRDLLWHRSVANASVFYPPT
jgi:serine/threonine-protein kinase HipA